VLERLEQFSSFCCPTVANRYGRKGYLWLKWWLKIATVSSLPFCLVHSTVKHTTVNSKGHWHSHLSVALSCGYCPCDQALYVCDLTGELIKLKCVGGDVRPYSLRRASSDYQTMTTGVVRGHVFTCLGASNHSEDAFEHVTIDTDLLNVDTLL
jgi:hypothetical protein